MNNLAQIPVAPNNGFSLPGRLGIGAQYTLSGTSSRLESVISIVIGVMTAIAFIWFVFLLFTGAVQFLTSGGDSKSVEAASGKIRTALIGLVAVISAIFFTQLLGTILGIDILSPGQIFEDLVNSAV